MSQFYVIGVSKTSWNRGPKIRQHPREKRPIYCYAMTEDGRFFSFRVKNAIEAAILRSKKKSRRTFLCTRCGSKFVDFKDQWKKYISGEKLCPLCG